MSHSPIFDGMTECCNTHLQQPTDRNTTGSYTTMSTAPTYAILLSSTSSREEESPNPGKPPSNQTVVGSSLKFGSWWSQTSCYDPPPPPPMDETKEDKTSEVDLIDSEQEEESTVVIPSLATAQEITRYVYDSPYDGLVPNPDTGISVELCCSTASQFLVNNCKLPTMICMLFGCPNFHNILDQSPFCNAKQQMKSKWKVVNENMKTDIRQHSYFLLKEIQRDDIHQ